MSDAPQPQFFRRVKGSGAEAQEAAACALIFDPEAPLESATTRLTWSGLMAGRLREVAHAAAATGKPEGKSLPYASLRAAFQVQVPDCVMLSHDLGRPWAREDVGTFMHVAEGVGGDCAARASAALRTWIGLVLRPWAERLELDEALVDAVDDAAAPDEAFAADHGAFQSAASGQAFNHLRHPLLQEISRRLDGAELFPGLGPVYRIVRSRSGRNEVQFQTWPAAARSGGLYSMLATVTLVTVPYLDRPLVVVRASRRRWLDEMPEPSRLRRYRSITGYLMGRNNGAASRGGPVAVEFSIGVRAGVPEEPCSPEFFHQALAVRADLAQPIAVMAQARSQDVFLGFPYSPQRDGKARVGAGATTRDNLDLLDTVGVLLAPMGMRPMPFRERETRREPKRAEEYHKALEAEALVAEFAVSLGSNELDGEDLIEAARMLMEGADPPEISGSAAQEGRAILEAIRSANRGRLRRAFGGAAPTVVLIARRESERLLMRAAITGLFGASIDVVERQLPRDVHGPRQGLPEADRKAKDRFAARVGAWRELADELSLTFGGCHALVQADEWYERKHDDPVNKLAGRHALATIGNANVQYLLPAAGGWRGLARYLNRIQAAIYDLMFGHAALVTEVRSLLKLDFPNAATRPRSIIGISLVTQAKLRNGASGGQVCLATRIDAETGQATARIGWFERAMQWTGWMPFFEAMKHVAGIEAGSLGPTEDAKRRSYQAFVAEVIDGAVAGDECPVVLLDSTSAAGMWPWLADSRIGGPLVIGPEGSDRTEAWESARLVRVRLGQAGRVLERKTARYQKLDPAGGQPRGEDCRYCPTATAKTIELARSGNGQGWHYWVTSGYFQSSLPRGLSVYRKLDSFVPVAKVRGVDAPPAIAGKGVLTPLAIDISDEPYRVPNAIDVTVASIVPGDDPARIAHLVASLRCGYGHSRLSTTLPAPLFFEAKARDYMARFAIDEVDDDDGGEEPQAPQPDDPAASQAEEATLDEDELLDAAEAAEAAEAVDAEGGVEHLEPPPPGAVPPLDGPEAAAPAIILVRPWSRLLRPSLSVSLVEATPVTRTRVELPFAAKHLPTGALTQSLAGMLAATQKFANTQTAPTAAQEAGGDAMDDDKESNWVEFAKDKTVPLPPFVTPEWLVSVTALPNNTHLVREIHRYRDVIRDLSGFDWPEERPVGRAAVAEMLIAGLRHLNFVDVVGQLAHLSLDKNRRKKFILFGPLYTRTMHAYWSEEVPGARKPLRRATARKDSDAARLLAEKGNRSDAVSILYTEALATGWDASMSAVVRQFEMNELDEFMKAMEPLADRFSSKAVSDAVIERFALMKMVGRTIQLPAPGPEDTVADGDGEDPVTPGTDEEDAAQVEDDEIGTGMASRGGLTPDEVDPPEDDGCPAGLEPESLPAEVDPPSDQAGEAAPAASIPSDTAASDTVDDAAQAARGAWRDALRWIADAANHALDAEPDLSALAAIVRAARNARSALRAWAAAQPRLADAQPLLERARAILASLADLPGAPPADAVLPGADSPVMVEPQMLDDAAGLVDEADRLLAEARKSQDECFTIMADKQQAFARFGEIATLKEAADEAMRAVVARVGAANAILVAGAAQAAPRTPHQAAGPGRNSSAAPAPATEPAPGEAAQPDGTASEESDGGGPDAQCGAAEIASVAAPFAVEGEDAPEATADWDGGSAPSSADATSGEDDPGYEIVEGEAATGEDVDGTMSDDLPPRVPVGSGNLFPAVDGPDPGDPMAEAAAARIREIVAVQAFGAAYHLRRAAGRVFAPQPGFGFTAEELRLAAMSGHIGHVAMQGSHLLEQVVSGAVEAVVAAGQVATPDDLLLARRIIVASACAELAMFHPSLPAMVGAEVIADTVPELNEAFRDLLAAVADGARYGLITPALLRTVGREKQDDLYLDSCRQAVLDKISAFSKMHFNWAPANRIRANLHLRSGVIGEYRERIEANDEGSVTAARAFAKEYRDRGAIMALAERIERGAVLKYKPLDGAARERIVSAFEELAAISAEYVDAVDAASSARTSSQKTLVQRIAHAVGAGAEKALRAVAAFAQSAPALPAAAAAFAEAALTRLKDASQGRFEQVGIHDHLLAVHGPLLWLPGFHYGASWLPSPYQPESVVTALLDQEIPPRSLEPDDEAFRKAVHERLAEGSFIAARLLIQAGAFYGIGDETREALADDCDANVVTCRSDLKDSLDDTRRLIDKVQRMGSLVRIDQANAVFAALDRIIPDSLPADVSLDARTEDEEPEQIMDFGAARDQIEDVRDRVSGLLDAPRAALLDRLDALQGRARDGDIAKVREIISAHDDLVTAGEYISFMEEGGELPERPFANRRFHEFYPRVPEFLAQLGKGVLDQARAAIEGGADLPGLPYSRLPAALRPEAVERLDIWRDLRRRVEKGDQSSAVHVLADRLFTAARMSPQVLTPTTSGHKLPPKTYVTEMRLTIPQDTESLLLPDFGSVVDFNYRIVIAPKLPSDGEMAALCQDAGTYGFMVIVPNLVEVRRREQLQLHCLEHNRRVLVIDEAIFLYALSEPEFRPQTMIECAQPFSFAAPYKDYGNSPVPPEMFFGREIEIRKIVDRMGSCVVYGGRRLGKTALLRHIEQQHSDPHTNGSTAVGYANIRDIGATPSRVWEAASRALTAIFTAQVKTASEFTLKVTAWLKEDSKRRVLLLLDEADHFIEGDSKQQQQFHEFSRLQELMDSTLRRFKVVLAGLHNVTRIVRTENSPLKQIASDPQRIGPLMDEELPDAERLVTRPMSAMGYEFKNRSDVWRILSHCNYYPVLVQTFCAGLLGILEKAAVRRHRPLAEITDRHVREAIEDEDIRREIEEKFAYTIREIDPRYELITCVVAERVLRDTQAGRVEEGMSTVEVVDAVATWWPVAFDHANRLETVKDLLDEMVGLGVLRQTASGAWALRSHAILRLLGDEDHVNTRLLDFETRPPPTAFDPRSMRRHLTLPREQPGYPCPLTWGQEHDLFAGNAHISVVFGNALADIGYVPDALRTADPASVDGDRVTVQVRHFADAAAMLEAMRPLARSTSRMMLVVDARAAWDASWIDAVARQRAVREGLVRMVFVGSVSHALRWVRSQRMAKLPPGVRVMALQPWADAYLDHELGDGNLPPERFANDLRRITGGYNRLMSSMLTGFSGNADRFSKSLRALEQRLSKDKGLLADLGLAPDLGQLFLRLAEWADASGRIGFEEIRDGVGEMLQALDLTAQQVVDYAVMMSVLEPQPTRPGDPPEAREFVILPLARAALSQLQAKTEAA